MMEMEIGDAILVEWPGEGIAIMSADLIVDDDVIFGKDGTIGKEAIYEFTLIDGYWVHAAPVEAGAERTKCLL